MIAYVVFGRSRSAHTQQGVPCRASHHVHMYTYTVWPAFLCLYYLSTFAHAVWSATLATPTPRQSMTP